MNEIVLITAIVLLVLLFLKVPVFIAILGGSIFYFIMTPGINPIVFAQQSIGGAESISLLAIPFFVGAGVAVRPDHDVAGADQAVLRQDGVFDAHVAALVIVGDVHLAGKIAHDLDLFGRVDVLVGGEVVTDQGHAVLVENLVHAHPANGLDGERRGYIVGQHHGHAALDDLSVRGDGLVRMPLQYLLC